MDSGDSQGILQTEAQPSNIGSVEQVKGKAQMKKTRIRVTYLAGKPQDVGKYYYGETWADENGEHFRVKFGKKIRTDRPWTFEEVRSK